MKKSWIAGLDESVARQISQDFVGSFALRLRLEELLRDKADVAKASVRKKDAYDIPNWAYLQADAVGYERALFDVISLISDKYVEK